MEGDCLGIEAVVFECGPVNPSGASAHAEFRIKIKHNGEVRFESAAGEAVDFVEHPQVDSPGVPLVDFRGIEETVGNHMDPLFQFGFQERFDHLRVTCAEQQQFCFGRQFLARLPRFQDGPQFLRDSRPAGGTHHMNLHSCRGKGFPEQGRLCGFPASFAPFQCDESASHC